MTDGPAARAATVEPAPAATVVLLRPGPDGLEALLTVRPSTMAFAAGMHVFPGGRVDAADAAPALAARSTIGAAEAAVRLGGDRSPADALATHVAAIRELWEEGGVLLGDTSTSPDAVAEARAAVVDGSIGFAEAAASLDLTLRTDLLMPLSRWVTPPTHARRFDACFFAALLPEAGVASLVGEEVVSIEWLTPRAALAAMARRRLGMWVPTSTTLQQLVHVADAADLERLAPGPLGAVTVDEPAPDVIRVVMPAGGGVAGQPVCAHLVGRRRFVLVDPGDPTGPGLERTLAEADARSGSITAIALTSVDPDHHAGAEALAERLSVPVFAGSGGGRWLPYDVVELHEGLTVDAGDVPLRAVLTPGPRPDHVAYVVGEGSTVLIGDLDGRRGARSIGAPMDGPALDESRARTRAIGARHELPAHPDGS